MIEIIEHVVIVKYLLKSEMIFYVAIGPVSNFHVHMFFTTDRLIIENTSLDYKCFLVLMLNVLYYMEHNNPYQGAYLFIQF